MGRIGTAKGNQTWKRNHAALGNLREVSDVRDVHVETLSSMADVRQAEAEMYAFQGRRQGGPREQHDRIQTHVVAGDRTAADRAVEQSQSLIDAAIAIEPRLAKRPQWERADDGVFADAGLVASGDDSPCYQMTRRSLREASQCGEPVKVVVSTDCATPTSLAAFVAVVRIVQQFRPVHVYWQGAWLADDGREAGYVYHAPVITGDMDFARLAYILADCTRDTASFAVAHSRAYIRDHTRLRGLGRHAERSYMPGAAYVSRDGIMHDADTIADTACRWLGIASPWRKRSAEESKGEAALQSLPKVWQDARTEAEKAESLARWSADSANREADRKSRLAAEAESRLAGIGQ